MVEKQYRGKVLVVDDDEDIRWMVAEKLRSHGYTVECASDGREALGKIQQLSGHASSFMLVTDLNMPIMDGVTLARTLRDLGITIRTVIWSSAPHLCKERVHTLFQDELIEGRFALLTKLDDMGQLLAFLRAA